MKTELKDVIHFYLGCEVQTSLRQETEQGQPMKKLMGKFVDCDLLVKDCIGIQLETMKGTIDDSQLPINSIKPLLRPLSDMTEEEKIELKSIEWPEDSEFFKPHLGFVYLLKHQFDLFGLIESGQAIDKTILK